MQEVEAQSPKPDRRAVRKRNATAVGLKTILIAQLALGACEPFPRDPEGTLERATSGTLRVGATEAPPWLVREADASASGPEAELIEAFARSIDAQIEWRWCYDDAHLHRLERYELDLAAGGLRADSPWKTRVTLTRPWRVDDEMERVLAVPPGENGMLVALERLIESRRHASRR